MGRGETHVPPLAGKGQRRDMATGVPGERPLADAGDGLLAGSRDMATAGLPEDDDAGVSQTGGVCQRQRRLRHLLPDEGGRETMGGGLGRLQALRQGRAEPDRRCGMDA